MPTNITINSSNTPLAFLRGTDASLKGMTGNYTDGTFYLTTDTKRLYTAIGEELVELNKSVEIVPNLNSLPIIDVTDGQFYYVKASNVLVYYDSSAGENGDGGYVQINPDTITILGVASAPVVHSDANPVAETPAITTVTPTLAYTSNAGSLIKGGQTPGTKQFPIHFYDGTNINITKQTINSVDGIKIRANEYRLDDTFDSGNGIYSANLKTSSDSSNYKQVAAESAKDISIKGSANVTLSKSTGEPLVITAADTKVAAANLSVDNEGKFGISVTSVRENTATTGAGHGSASSTIKPIVRYGIATTTTTETENPDGGEPIQNTTTTYSGNRTFSEATTNGVTDIILDVYTQSEVDNLIASNLQSYNALQYKGTITSQDDFLTVEAAGVSNGDVWYIAPSASSGYITYNGVTYRTNDLVIYTGTENNSGIIPGPLTNNNRILVPSGNDTVGMSQVDTNTTEGAEKYGTYAIKQNGVNLNAVQHRGSTNVQVTLTHDTTNELTGASGAALTTAITTTRLVWGTFEATTTEEEEETTP